MTWHRLASFFPTKVEEFLLLYHTLALPHDAHGVQGRPGVDEDGGELDFVGGNQSERCRDEIGILVNEIALKGPPQVRNGEGEAGEPEDRFEDGLSGAFKLL